ncbi:MAG: aldehyde dehydrogenase family protein [Elusimicrobia bacterium]|nr:aldehyde dehydrogenase family protein [Elusimicrobiota bacterium]
MLKARTYMIEHIDDVAQTISKDNGKPLSEALSADIYPVADLMSYFAKNTQKLLRPKKIGIGVWNMLLRSSQLHFFPAGVIGIISPWNFPLSIPFGEIVMSLMAGNCVIHKASSATPLVGQKIEEIIKAAGLPEGVFTNLPGDSSTGTALIEAGVDKILFTGSVAVGKKVMEMAAKTLTPVVLELGGKDPMIVCADADLETASSAAVWGAFTNSGQVCASVERVYVHETVAEEFIAKVMEKTKKLRQGPGHNNHDVDVGAMTTEGQLREVEEQISDAKKRGARILIGGERNSQFKGWFYKPTILTGVDHTFKTVMEETFGPTMPIMIFKTEDEAVRLSNDTTFGLTASVWTKDISRGYELAKQIKAGTVTVNECVYTHAVCQTPWGGHGDSGYGRTHSYLGLMEVVRPQHIHISRLTFMKDFWWYPYGEPLYRLFKKAAATLTTGDLCGFLPSLGTMIRLARLKKI